MEGGLEKVKDPFGYNIIVMDASCFPEEVTKNPDIYNGIHTVIERPAFIIVVTENEIQERYYYRSIGWTKSVLIRAQLNGPTWEANDCIFDPADSFIKKLAVKGRIVAVDLPEPL